MAIDTELAEYDAQYRQWVTEKASKCESAWRSRHAPFAWVEHEPAWMLAADMWEYYLPELTGPCRRILRFALAGGGQIRTAETFVQTTFSDGKLFFVRDPHQVRLRITAHLADQVVRVTGTIETTECYEADRSAVVLPRGSEQAIADRIAATLRVIQSPGDFFALLDGSEGCAICGRTLVDEVSKLLNIGPSCARQLGLPHNLSAAGTVVARRRGLLAQAEQDAARNPANAMLPPTQVSANE